MTPPYGQFAANRALITCFPCRRSSFVLVRAEGKGFEPLRSLHP